MTNNPTPRGDELLEHLVECLRLLDERVQVAVERAIAAREAHEHAVPLGDPEAARKIRAHDATGGQWQTITGDEDVLTPATRTY